MSLCPSSRPRPSVSRLGIVSLVSCTACKVVGLIGGGTPVVDPCGNDRVDPEESCDGSALAGQTCVGLGFGDGPLGCQADCRQFDTGACSAPTGGAHFVEPSRRWAVPFPATAVPLNGGFSATLWAAGEKFWTTLDMNGDTLPDLVWTAEPTFDGIDYSADVWGFNTAQPYWRVFLNTGDGFAASDQHWAVPVADSAVPLEHGFNAVTWSGGAQYWSTFDLNGDGLPDFVWSGEPKQNTNGFWADVWGYGSATPYWRVFLNTGYGFAATEIRWPVPVLAGSFALLYGFYAPEWNGGCQQWSTLDLNGDALPDFVWSGEPKYDGETYSADVWGLATGNPHWRVYLNTGTGFAAATDWAVPRFEASYEPTHGFYATAWHGGSQFWSTFDLDADTRPDLVWTAEPHSDGTLFWGTVWSSATSPAYWKYYRNTGHGFSSAVAAWPVPAMPAGSPLSFGFRATHRSTGSERWSTFDLNGDRRADLIWHGEPKTDGVNWWTTVWGFGTAAHYWRVFLNHETGFYDSFIRWPVPTPDSATALDQGFNDDAWGAGGQEWRTLDLNGDAQPDFIWTGEPKHDAIGYYTEVWGYGTDEPYWRVFVNER